MRRRMRRRREGNRLRNKTLSMQERIEIERREGMYEGI
jgi:hypothetical protein